jgi:endonuclease YncB( thermonuclease family)
LADYVGLRTVSCDQRDVDRYGRGVTLCHVGREDLNAWLVSQG